MIMFRTTGHCGKAIGGFTFIEMMVSMSVFSFAMMFMGYLTLFQARETKHVHMTTKADKNSHEIMEFIRYKVVKGQFGTMQITDNGRTLQFVDPTLSLSGSQFRFVNGVVYYDDDIANGPTWVRAFDNVGDIRFASEVNGNVVRVTLKNNISLISPVYYNSERVFRIYLRN